MLGRPIRAVLAVALAVAALGAAEAAAAQNRSFPDWLSGLRSEALRSGVSRSTVDAALRRLEPIPRVLELARRQPEFRMTFPEYLDRVVPPARIAAGRERLAEERLLLDRVSGEYGVPPAVVVALWGVESDYGRRTGEFPVIASLATLAYDGRRAAFFRKELLNALRIADAGHVPLAEMRGSWAGAMGQNQFMPSSFVAYAADGDGDGHRDIWRNRADVFASTANYLSRVGWRPGEPWGMRVLVPPGAPVGTAEFTGERSMGEWAALGLTRADGRPLRDEGLPAEFVMPEAGGPAFLVHRNFRVWLRWNNSRFFALAVGTLADAIAGS